MFTGFAIDATSEYQQRTRSEALAWRVKKSLMRIELKTIPATLFSSRKAFKRNSLFSGEGIFLAVREHLDVAIGMLLKGKKGSGGRMDGTRSDGHGWLDVVEYREKISGCKL